MAHLGEAGQLDDVSQEALESVGKGGSGGMIPAGWYRVALVEDEAQSKSWGTGLSQQFQILDGPLKGRRIFDYLCVRHSTSAKAEEIARAKLKAFAVAAGAKNPNNVTDTEPYYGKPVMMEVRRETQENEKYADEDGKKAEPADFVSCSEFKAWGSTASAPTNSTRAQPSAPPPEDDIPF